MYQSCITDSSICMQWECMCLPFVSRAALRWHCSVTGRHWRQTPGVYVLCIRACSSTDSWATHRLRYKLFVCCTQWVTQINSTYRGGKRGCQMPFKMCLNVYFVDVDNLFLFLKNIVCLYCSRIALSRRAKVFIWDTDTHSCKCRPVYWNMKPHLSHRLWCCPLPHSLLWLVLISSPHPYCSVAKHWTACSQFPLPSLSFTVWPWSVCSTGGEKTSMELRVTVDFFYWHLTTAKKQKNIDKWQ